MYSAIIYTGYKKAVRDHKRDHMFVFSLKEVVEELKHIITKEEETNMFEKDEHKKQSKEVKNLGDMAETTSFFGRPFSFYKEKVNELTLSNLLNNKPTDADYDQIISVLKMLAQSTYAQYDFLIFKSPDEVENTNLLQIVSKAEDNPKLHKELFAKAMDSNIDYNELVKRFAAEVASGNVIELGDDVVVITNDGTNISPTGVSQINNGLKDGDIAFIISFIKKENLDAFNKKHLPQAPEQEAPQAPAQDGTIG